MKRHNAKALAAAVAIAAAAAANEGKKKMESKLNSNASALYVDVVKNMSKAESSSPPTTPAAPKFTILREDFPALPGTPAAVPDDWTAMISDDDEDEDNEDENEDDDDPQQENKEIVVELATPVLEPEPLVPAPEPVAEPVAVAKSAAYPDLVVELDNCRNFHINTNFNSIKTHGVAIGSGTSNTSSSSSNCSTSSSGIYRENFYDCLGNGIFDKNFLTAGVGQRSWRRQQIDPNELTIGPPPGFEHVKFYGRLRTNRLGMPLGGVTFDLAPPQQRTRNSRSVLSRASAQPDSNPGAYGMAGLAGNLKIAQQNPQLLSQIFGHDTSGLNVDTQCCATGANKLHACFAGPLQGGRCAPHEVHHDVPAHYLHAGGQDMPQPKIDQMEVELLFLFFYTYPGDMMQMLAAAELAERGWRFHIYERVWLLRQPDNPHYTFRGIQESGEYNYFNMVHWKILPRHFDLLPDQLERTITKGELREQYGYHPQMSFF